MRTPPTIPGQATGAGLRLAVMAAVLGPDPVLIAIEGISATWTDDEKLLWQ
jgi:hypothetical protein